MNKNVKMIYGLDILRTIDWKMIYIHFLECLLMIDFGLEL